MGLILSFQRVFCKLTMFKIEIRFVSSCLGIIIFPILFRFFYSETVHPHIGHEPEKVRSLQLEIVFQTKPSSLSQQPENSNRKKIIYYLFSFSRKNRQTRIPPPLLFITIVTKANTIKATKINFFRKLVQFCTT